MFKRFRRFVLYPLLCVCGCHMALTGSPIPLRYVETLQNPQRVASIGEGVLVLEDGKSVVLPYIKDLPVRHPVWIAAINEGVELTTEGEAFGLVEVERICGNDPVYSRKLKVKLSDLAAVLHPRGIDLDSVPADCREALQSIVRETADRPVRVDGYLLLEMKSVRRCFEGTFGSVLTNDELSPSSRTRHDRRTGVMIF